MRKLLLLPLSLLFLCFAVVGQQPPPPQSLTFYYDYSVNSGKEEEFMNLIKTVGAPVRDKLLAEGVVLAWGMETPVLRYPGGTTHLIWFSVANWDGVDKVLNAMEAQLAKIAADEAKTKPPKTTAQRMRETFDMSKTRDWLVRDVITGFGPPPAAGVLRLLGTTSLKRRQVSLQTIERPGKNTTSQCSTNLSPMESYSLMECQLRR